MRLIILVICICSVLALASTFDQSPAPKPSGVQLTLEGLSTLKQGLSQMVEELPRYTLPEINQNGDIIVRRVDPEEADQSVLPLTRKGVGL